MTNCIYADYFGFDEEPFGITPDPDFLYLSKSHSSALEWMTYAIEQHEMGLVLGEVGSGKTVLSRMLVDSLSSKDNYRISWIINPQLSPSGLLKEIYGQLFNKKPKYFKRDVIRDLQEKLADFFVNDIYPVVIIDEAQMIPSKAVFDEIRLLSNFQTDKQSLISIILMGQPELERRLKRRTYRSLVQRIRFTTTLNPLGNDEVEAYIFHRLKKAGFSGEIPFSSESLELMQKMTRGFPRPLNHLASFTLMELMQSELPVADSELVKKASKNINYLNWGK